MHRTLPVVLAGTLGVTAGALAQFTNADFETGDLSGWSVTPTPNGQTLFSLVADHDLDGPGAVYSLSRAAKFGVGKVAGTTPGDGGILLTQNLSLQGGSVYTFECDYGVYGPPPRTVTNAHGGRFQLVVDGQVIATANVGQIQPQVYYSGHLSGQFTPPSNGFYAVGVRIARDYLPSQETIPLHQYVDNFLPAGPGPCYADCDTSTGVGVLDIFDFLCFQNRFAASAAYACDCDTATGVGVCDIFDFLCFQNRFAAGCP